MCAGEELNLHALASAATSRLCGYRYATRALKLPISAYNHFHLAMSQFNFYFYFL